MTLLGGFYRNARLSSHLSLKREKALHELCAEPVLKTISQNLYDNMLPAIPDSESLKCVQTNVDALMHALRNVDIEKYFGSIKVLLKSTLSGNRFYSM